MIKKYLDDLEARINGEEEKTLYGRWKEFYDGKTRADIFIPERKNKYPAKITWPDISINAAIQNAAYEDLLVRELKAVSETLEKGAGNVLAVRANYGTGILPSVFGADLFFLDDCADTLPTAKPFNDKDKIRAIIERGIPRGRSGLMPKVFGFADYYREVTKSYPKIKQYIHLYHPDFQGPMDVAELLWGSRLFLDIYDYPALVKEILVIVTDTFIHFMRAWKKTAPSFDAEHIVHWGLMARGQVMLPDDSAMNFSPEMYEEFIRPYDQKIFDAFGGGLIHFCGRGSHFIPRLAQMKNLSAINLSQPHLNDMDVIYANTIEKDVRIVGFDYNFAGQEQRRGQKFHGKLHCHKPV